MRQLGRALFAKIGKPISTSLAATLSQQIQRKTPTYLFVAASYDRNEPFAIYQCRLIALHSSVASEHRDLVPAYLRARMDSVGTWFEIDTFERVAQGEVKRILAQASGREASSSLRGMTALFKVKVIGSGELKKTLEAPSWKARSKIVGDDFDSDLYDAEDGTLDWISDET